MEQFLSPEAKKRGREDEREVQAVPALVAQGDVVEFVPDISATKGDILARPILNTFPLRTFSDRQRRFNGSAAYKVYDWVEYSILKDAAFCFCCRHFGHSGIDPAFTLNGFLNWNKPKGMSDHEITPDHKLSHLTWIEFQNVLAGREKSIAVRLCKEGDKLKAENQFYIKTVCTVIRMLALQALPLRGHREGEYSLNRGNFIETLMLISDHDEIVKRKLTEKENAKYTSPDIQNELLGIMATLVREGIVRDVERSRCYAFICDETKDITKIERLACVLRFVDMDNYEPTEALLDISAGDGLDAESISNHIFAVLSRNSVQLSMMKFQCYDGANVMSGSVSGVQKRIRGMNPEAVYTHCFAHRLNLVVVNAMKGAGKISEVLELLSLLYSFLSGSSVHIEFQREQAQLISEKVIDERHPISLKSYTDTCWVSRYESCNAVFRTLPAIHNTLSFYAAGGKVNNAERTAIARGLLPQFDTSFVVHLCILRTVLGVTKMLSETLQDVHTDIGSAVDTVEGIKAELEEWDTDAGKTNSKWEAVWNLAIGVCNIAEVPEPVEHRRRRVRADFFDSPVITTKSEYQIHVWSPIILRVVEELIRRFSDGNLVPFKGISSLTPGTQTFMNEKRIVEFAAIYGIEKEIEWELRPLKKQLDRVQEDTPNSYPDTLCGLLNFVAEYKAVYFNTYRLLIIAVTHPVSSARAERAFSLLKRIRTWLRCSSGTERLNDLAILANNSARTKALDMDDVVKRFASKNRRFIL